MVVPMGGIEPPTQDFHSTTPETTTKNKAVSLVGFGNAFGNKGVVLPQTLVIPIDLAEEVCGELDFTELHHNL